MKDTRGSYDDLLFWQVVFDRGTEVIMSPTFQVKEVPHVFSTTRTMMSCSHEGCRRPCLPRIRSLLEFNLLPFSRTTGA